jgi:hypothetical protein
MNIKHEAFVCRPGTHGDEFAMAVDTNDAVKWGDELLQACIDQCREEISRARARRAEILNNHPWADDFRQSDYQYGLETAIEIIEKVMKEGP